LQPSPGLSDQMLDINGQELRQGGLVLLLCEVAEISAEGVRIRVMNSDMELLVGVKHDEVLGGLVADSELTAFHPDPAEIAPPAAAESSCEAS
jgi:hypothetical protein